LGVRYSLLDRDAGEISGVGLGPGLEISLGSLRSAADAVLGGDALDAVVRVDVLVENDLVAGGAALAGDDGRVGKEELPDLCLS
jgi:hypothetical protein